jgi:hypothetical protein
LRFCARQPYAGNPVPVVVTPAFSIALARLSCDWRTTAYPALAKSLEDTMRRTTMGNDHRLGQRSFGRLCWLSALAGGGLIAACVYAPGIFLALAVASGLALAVAERVHNLPSSGRNLSSVAPSGLPLGDGGCFPGGAPSRENATPSSAVVIDGGSLEHQRKRRFPQLDVVPLPLVQAHQRPEHFAPPRM